jgi:hypothetical protein
MTDPPARAARPPLAVQALVLAGVVAVVLVGFWVFANPLSRAVDDATGLPSYWTTFVLSGAWFVVAAGVLFMVQKARPGLRLPVGVGFVVTAVAVGGVFAWTTFTDDRADDDVSFAEQAVPASQMPEVRAPEAKKMNVVLSSGTFSGIEHRAEGKAQIVRLANGEVRLVFTEFDVERAPDLRVYLAESRVTGDVGPYREIDKLKGNVGDQYYKLPDSLDLDRYRHVVIWCKAFDTGVAQAPLADS